MGAKPLSKEQQDELDQRSLECLSCSVGCSAMLCFSPCLLPLMVLAAPIALPAMAAWGVADVNALWTSDDNCGFSNQGTGPSRPWVKWEGHSVWVRSVQRPPTWRASRPSRCLRRPRPACRHPDWIGWVRQGGPWTTDVAS